MVNSPSRTPLVGFCSSLPYARCADLGYILCTPPWILKEVEKEVLFDRWDLRSVGNRTAVSSSPDGNHALTSSGIRLCRRSLRTRNGIHGIICRSFLWKRVRGPTRSSGGRRSGDPTETLLFVSSPSSSF